VTFILVWENKKYSCEEPPKGECEKEANMCKKKRQEYELEFIEISSVD
jgi:hypothetical protein